MTAPPSPVLSEVLSSCCSTADEELRDCSHSDGGSPELKRAKRQHMRTKLEDLFKSKIHSEPVTGVVQIVSNMMQEYASRTSYQSAEEEPSGISPLSLGDHQTSFLSDKKSSASNDCKGIDTNCCCCSHSVDESTEMSVELRHDRMDKVVSSYYSHFKRNCTTGDLKVLQSDEDTEEEKIELLDEDDAYREDNMVLNGFHLSNVVLEGDDPAVDGLHRSPVEEDKVSSLNGVKTLTNLCECGDDFIAEPSVVNDSQSEDEANCEEVESLDGSPSGDANLDKAVSKQVDLNLQQIDLVNITGGNSVPVESSPIVSTPCRNSLVEIYENLFRPQVPSDENHQCDVNESQDTQNDSGQFLGRRIDKEFRSELEFSTVLTLAYVRVRDLTNNIDKAQEYLSKIEKDGEEEEDINELRYEIQSMFDNRANLSLEQAKWRSQFSDHFQQRKKVLATLKSRAFRSEQTYFQLRKELMELEKEQIIPKRKRSLFSRIFSFGFVK